MPLSPAAADRALDLDGAASASFEFVLSAGSAAMPCPLAATAALSMATLLALAVIPAAFAQTCDTSGSSASAEGVGNTVAVGELLAFGTPCLTFVSSIKVDYAYEPDELTTVIVGMATFCDGFPEANWTSIGDYASPVAPQTTYINVRPRCASDTTSICKHSILAVLTLNAHECWQRRSRNEIRQ